MSNRLAGKTALVTGGSRGIGLAIADAFAAEGCALWLNGRDPARLETAARGLATRHGVSVRTHAADVCNEQAVAAMATAVCADRAPDILVNNAGIHVANAFLDYSFADFRRVIEANVYSVFLVTQALLPAMIAHGGGRVINLASTAGKWGSRNQSAYNASKHAVVGLTRCLGLEMAAHNVLVNAICPWVVDTDMAQSFIAEHSAAAGISEEELTARLTASVPLGRLVRPQEVAGLALYLASDAASYINGQSWTVDGGYTVI